MTAIQLFFTALITGAILFGAEVFVPGGILGVLGGIALLIAIVTGFAAFPAYGALIALGIVIVAILSLVLWIKIWPKTPMGKLMFANKDLSTSKASEAGLNDLVGKKGVADTALHPGGFAVIGNQRYSVITYGEMIDKASPIKVINVEGNRVVVEERQSIS